MTIIINNVNDSKLRDFLFQKSQKSNFISNYTTCYTSSSHTQGHDDTLQCTQTDYFPHQITMLLSNKSDIMSKLTLPLYYLLLTF